MRTEEDGVGTGLGAHDGITNLQGLIGGCPYHGKISTGSRKRWACHPPQSLRPPYDDQAPCGDRNQQGKLCDPGQ